MPIYERPIPPYTRNKLGNFPPRPPEKPQQDIHVSTVEHYIESERGYNILDVLISMEEKCGEKINAGNIDVEIGNVYPEDDYAILEDSCFVAPCDYSVQMFTDEECEEDMMRYNEALELFDAQLAEWIANT